MGESLGAGWGERGIYCKSDYKFAKVFLNCFLTETLNTCRVYENTTVNTNWVTRKLINT
jgi:hypothetical protein